MKDTAEQVIDRSAKTVVSFFIASAGLWLLAAALLAYVAAAKLTDPFFLSSFELLTYGKVKVAQANAFVYGWGGNSIFAVTLWILARLSQAEIRGRILLLFAGALWNLGITFGLLGILDGHMNAHEMLEMPTSVWPVLFISYSIIAFLALVIHRSRMQNETIAPQWFILASLIWFPALFLIAWNGLEINPSRGTLPSVLSLWFGQSLIWLWLTPMALGAAYYLIPTILGRPIDKYYLAIFGFWCIAALAPWSVVHHLEGASSDVDSGYRNRHEYCYDFPYCSGFHELSCHCFSGHLESMERPATEICYFRNHILYFIQLHRRHFFLTGRCQGHPIFNHQRVSLQPACIRFLQYDHFRFGLLHVA